MNLQLQTILSLTITLVTATTLAFSPAAPTDPKILALKGKILQIANNYSGQGDPDQSKQRSLEPFVNQLVQISKMPPIKERIPILAGAWKQIWGPYEYKNDDGGIDPKIGIQEIYQVVFADGYYYNVSPYYPNGNRSKEQIALLRGQFQLDPTDVNGLRVKFTNYPGVDQRPKQMNIWDLAAIAEAGQLEGKITIVPTWIVRLFFGGGKLEEVYTDNDLRILYGSKGKAGARRSLYIMTRMSQ